DEIVVISKSVKKDSPAVEWRGRPDGTYDVRPLPGDLSPGTQVILTAREDVEELFAFDRLAELTRHYGGMLPYPIKVSAGKRSELVNERGVPWRQEFASEKERSRALLTFGREAFGIDFFDAIPLRVKAGDIDGVAYILPHEASLTGRRAHRVYLKNMLLSEEADNLLPDWAFFVKAVVNANDLRPTASRESFYEDEKLDAAREALGESLRQYLMRLATDDPARLEKFISLHALSIKSLALQDDNFYRTFVHWLTFETSMGEMTLGEYREANQTIRFVPELDQFRQVVRVAGAQKMCILNGGYVHDADLLAKYAEIFPDVAVEVIDPNSLAQTFDDLQMNEQDAVHAFLSAADAALKPFRCAADVKKFLPKELPAMYTTNREGRFLRDLEQSKEIANPLMKDVLDSISRRERRPTDAHSQLCFNFHNRL